MHTTPTLTPTLAALADGRDHIRTSEYARLCTNQPQTVRKNVSKAGHCYGIRPVKVGGHLLWPVADVAALLAGEGAK
jgi:hypothetical protein